VTGTDTANASASLVFDLKVATGSVLTASVVTRSDLVMPGVTAHELISATPTGNRYSFKNMSIDIAAGTGLKTLTADLFANGSGTEHQLGFTLKGAGGAALQSFQLNGAVTTANNWNVTETYPVGGYTFAATHASSSIGAETAIGKLTLTLPAIASGSSVLDLSAATMGGLNAPARSLSFSQSDIGASGQFSDILPNGNLAVALSRGIADLQTAGATKPITAADALDALKLSVGLPSSKGSSFKELIAADVVRDGRVTAADALEILKVSVGISSTQPSWVFVPTDASLNPNLASMTRTAVTYKDEINLASITGPTAASIVGILVGDVNNSWTIPT
jgi:hypothetical protein